MITPTSAAPEVRGSSPERVYVTDANRGDPNIRRHIARYEFAARHIPAGARTLDCSCGSGYGTELLAKMVPQSYIIGVDNSYDAIGYAQSSHWCEGSYYLLSDAAKLTMLGDSLDAVVSLETIEHLHLRDCQAFLRDCSRWIKPGGAIVLSSPMLRYKDGLPYVTSPHHVNEMPRGELLQMLVGDIFRFPEWVLHFHHQDREAFPILLDEREGFLVVVGRKRLAPWKGDE